MARGKIKDTGAVAGLVLLVTRVANAPNVQGIVCNRNQLVARSALRRSRPFSALLFRVLIVSARRSLACNCVGHAIPVAVRGFFSQGSGRLAILGFLSIAFGPRPEWFPRPSLPSIPGLQPSRFCCLGLGWAGPPFASIGQGQGRSLSSASASVV